MGSASTDDGKEHGTELSLSVNLGPLQLSATRTVSVGRLLAASAYNRHLNQIVKTYGELDGMRVEFAHGRDMLNWEIGMFCTFSSKQDALSIVARHILHDTLSHITNDTDSNAPTSFDSDMLTGFCTIMDRLLMPTAVGGKRRLPTPISKFFLTNRFTKIVARPTIGFKLKLPNVIVCIPLLNLQHVVYARLAAAIVIHKLRDFEGSQQKQTEHTSRLSQSIFPKIAVSEKSFAIRYFAPLTELETLTFFVDTINLSGCMAQHVKLAVGGIHVEVRANKCLVGAVAFSDQDKITNARAFETLFNYQLGYLLDNEKEIPDDYFRALEASLPDVISLGDVENEARIRAYIRARRNIQCDSSQLYGDSEVMAALIHCQEEWNSKRVQGRDASGKTPKDDTSVYHLIRQRLQQNISNANCQADNVENDTTGCALEGDAETNAKPNDGLTDHVRRQLSRMYGGKLRRRDELSVFAEIPDMQRRTGSSVERLWLGSLFESEDTRTMGWIKRRRRLTFVETFTEYFVVMPVERRVVAWTKRSYYNSLQVPWQSHVRSRMSLSALSSICLLSACVYPSPRAQRDQGLDAGDAILDHELFEENVRNAGRGIGYAISRLKDEHREAQLRQSGAWSQAPLKLGSFVSLVYSLLHWLDAESKAWVVRETLTLLHASDVTIVIDPCVSATLAKVMFDMTAVLQPFQNVRCDVSSSSSSSSSSASTSASSSSRSSTGSMSNENTRRGRFSLPQPPPRPTYVVEDYDDYDYDNDVESQDWNNGRCSNSEGRGGYRLPLPAVVVDCGMPAGGIYVYHSRERNGEFVLTRDSGKNWRYRQVREHGARKVIAGKKRKSVQLSADLIDRVDVMNGTERLF